MKEIWKRYMHIERLGAEEIEGLLEMDNIWIEPKLDGANATILMDKDGNLTAAKRSQVLGEGDDLRGLKAYVSAHKDKFHAFFVKYPNHLIYGEWLVKHTVKHYRESAWGKFYAFDILNLDTHQFYNPDKRIEMLNEFDINQISPLIKLKGPLVTEEHMKQLQWYVDNNKYLIDEDGMTGEGIVIKGFDSEGNSYHNKYGRTTWLKIVANKFKEKHTLAMGVTSKELKTEPEVLFCEQFLTPARIEKIKQKILTDKGTGWKSEYIHEILGRAYYDAFSEELWGFIKKEKIRSINFKTLQKLCIIKTKKLIGL